MTDDSMLIKDSCELELFLKNRVRCMVLFGQSDCLHCSVMETIMESVRNCYPTIYFGYVIDNDVVGESFGVMTFPTIIFFENGNVIGTLVGSERCGSFSNVVDAMFGIK